MFKSIPEHELAELDLRLNRKLFISLVFIEKCSVACVYSHDELEK